MCVDGVELQVIATEEFRQGTPKVVEPEPEAIHAGVYFQVIPQTALVARGRSLDRPRGARR